MTKKLINKRAILTLLLAMLLLCISATACSTSTKSTDVKATNSKKESTTTGSIVIKYIGNSCFSITFADGTKLVTDPYGSSYASYFAPFPSLQADFVTISHSHGDHTSGLSEIKGTPKVLQYGHLNTPLKVGDVEISAYSSIHAADMGENIIFVYKEGDYKIVHMGETDNIESPEAKAAVKDADVLLTYAGEYGTIKNKDSFETLSKLNIKVMIPQHYSMDASNLFYGQPTIDTILTELPAGTKVTKSKELVVTKNMEKQFVVLTPN